MSYELINLAAEEEYRAKYIEIYCDFKKPIYTHDGIHVKFFPDRFDHAFFESKNWKIGDKSTFSLERAQRLLWIKQTLQDKSAILYEGWDKDEKVYKKENRVSVVCGDYVVVIWIQKPKVAKFITAYKADKSIDKIKAGPIWKPY